MCSQSFFKLMQVTTFKFGHQPPAARHRVTACHRALLFVVWPVAVTAQCAATSGHYTTPIEGNAPVHLCPPLALAQLAGMCSGDPDRWLPYALKSPSPVPTVSGDADLMSTARLAAADKSRVDPARPRAVAGGGLRSGACTGRFAVDRDLRMAAPAPPRPFPRDARRTPIDDLDLARFDVEVVLAPPTDLSSRSPSNDEDAVELFCVRWCSRMTALRR